MSRRIRTVRAGLTYRLAIWGLGYGVFALLWGITQGPFSSLIAAASTHSSSSAAANGTSYVSAAWNWAPLWIGALLFIAIVSDAAFERRLR